MRVGALLVLSALGAIFAGAAPAAAASGIWTPAVSAREADAFWTPQRMREAKPVEVGRPHLHPASGSAPRRRGRPHRVAPEAPRLSIEASGFEQVADPTAPEFRIHGAIFLSLGIFGYGRCSGTAVHSGNQSVVFTAAHCINSGGREGRWFPGRWVFVPAYRYGQRPFGVFPARWLDTTRQWRRSGSENFDVGAAVVGRNGRGETLGEAVGGAGIAWNLKARQTFDVHGYPAEEPFDGETQRICRNMPFIGHDPSSFLWPGPLNLAVPCGVTGGASGGGWTIDGDTLNGVTNYGYFDDTTPDFGAYFGKEVARLYGRAAKVR
ncbi:MAG: trypsin-like serine peptidase [Solirubrobacterales bacterium]